MDSGKPEPNQKNRNSDPAGRKDPARVLRRYQRRTNRANAADLIECFRDLVEQSVGRFHRRLPPNVDLQDLKQAGMFGLIQAARSSDPHRDLPFDSFPRSRLVGSLHAELRAHDWFPRRNGSRPGARNLFLHLAGDLAGPRDRELFGPGEEDMEEDSVLDTLHREELLDRVRRSLTPIEWKILHDSYIKGKTLKQVARKLSISASYVCALRSRIIAKLRRQVEESSYFFSD